MQTAYHLHCTAAVHPILLLHPISDQSCGQVPVKASKPQVRLAHRQDNRSKIHWSRTTWPWHLQVQGPAKGKHAWSHSWSISQSSHQSPSAAVCTPRGEAQPGQLEKEKGGAAVPSPVSVYTGANTSTALCPWDLCLAVFLVCIVCRCAHRYCFILL